MDDLPSVGEMAAAIRVNLYRHAPNMPNYRVGIVEPVIQRYADRIAALEAALREVADACKNEGRGNPIVYERMIERCEDIVRSALTGDSQTGADQL